MRKLKNQKQKHKKKKDVAKEKLEELTASEEVEKAEENFVELGAKAEEVKEEVEEFVEEKTKNNFRFYCIFIRIKKKEK